MPLYLVTYRMKLDGAIREIGSCHEFEETPVVLGLVGIGKLSPCEPPEVEPDDDLTRKTAAPEFDLPGAVPVDDEPDQADVRAHYPGGRRGGKAKK